MIGETERCEGTRSFRYRRGEKNIEKNLWNESEVLTEFMRARRL